MEFPAEGPSVRYLTAVEVVKDRQERHERQLAALEQKFEAKILDHDMRLRRLEVAIAKVSVLIVAASAVASALMSWALNRF